jgi:hypothetical protein
MDMPKGILYTDLTDAEQAEVRRRILQFFRGRPRKTIELVNDPEFTLYDRLSLRDVVYGLERGGLLWKRGFTSGAYYLTTREGLALLDEEPLP